ncbi:MAG: hypothetical protein ACYCXU_00145 [Thermoleophilia bacterium]
MSQRRKKPRPARPAKPRNPFAGRPRSGAGFHEEAKYGKKERRRKQEEIETGYEPGRGADSGQDKGVKNGGEEPGRESNGDDPDVKGGG